jgi:hypothetical protein
MRERRKERKGSEKIEGGYERGRRRRRRRE